MWGCMAETLTDLQTKLTRVQTAIDKIESGRAQSYSIDGDAFTNLDLPTLYTREARLQAKITRLEGGGIRTRRVVPR